jgi:hypothetical protein
LPLVFGRMRENVCPHQAIGQHVHVLVCTSLCGWLSASMFVSL